MLISHFPCLGCGEPLPAWRGSWCNACIEWDDPPGAPYPPQGDEDNPDPDPSPGHRWSIEDQSRDLAARHFAFLKMIESKL